MSHRIVIDASGTSTVVELTPEEQARQEAKADVFAAAVKAEQQQTAAIQSALDAARPGAVIRQKLKDGTALTSAELQTVVRWLAIREAREILG